MPAQPESVTAARHFLCQMLSAWGLAELTDTVALAASELLTNAVVHARTSFEVTVLADQDLLVSVRDSAVPWRLGQPADLPDWPQESGRGLALVAAVSHQWGVRPEPDGKTVWFTVALP